MNEHAAELPAESRNTYAITVEPIRKTSKGWWDRIVCKPDCPKLSVAVGSTQFTDVPDVPSSVETVISIGQPDMTGGIESTYPVKYNSINISLVTNLARK